MGKYKLFLKAIVWNIIGFLMTIIVSYLWFGQWKQSLIFSSILIIISTFTYVLYELIWNKFIKKK